MSRPKKIVEIELDKNEEIPEKAEVRSLSGRHIGFCSGETYEHAIREAWDMVNRKAESLSKATGRNVQIDMVDYYKQHQTPTSCPILFSYNVK